MFFIDLIRKICCCFSKTSSSEHEPILGEDPYRLDSNNGGPILPAGDTGYSSPIIPPTTDSYNFSINVLSASGSTQNHQPVFNDEDETLTPVGSLSSSAQKFDDGFYLATNNVKRQNFLNSAPSSPNGSTTSGGLSANFNTPDSKISNNQSSYNQSPQFCKSASGTFSQDHADIFPFELSSDSDNEQNGSIGKQQRSSFLL